MRYVPRKNIIISGWWLKNQGDKILRPFRILLGLIYACCHDEITPWRHMANCRWWQKHTHSESKGHTTMMSVCTGIRATALSTKINRRHSNSVVNCQYIVQCMAIVWCVSTPHVWPMLKRWWRMTQFTMTPSVNCHDRSRSKSWRMTTGANPSLSIGFGKLRIEMCDNYGRQWSHTARPEDVPLLRHSSQYIVEMPVGLLRCRCVRPFQFQNDNYSVAIKIRMLGQQ